MQAELTREQMNAIDVRGHEPAKFIDPLTREKFVLLRTDDFEWVRNLLPDEPDVPHISDARTGEEYAVVAETRYERFKAFFEEDPLSPQEKRMMVQDAGKRAGWDNPAFDVYDHETEAS